MANVPDPFDYKPLMDMISKATGWSFKKVQEQFDLFKNAYNKNSKLADIVSDKLLGELDRNIDDAKHYREQQRGIYDPLKEQYAAAAQDYASPERQEYEAGKAAADVAEEYEQARKVASDRLEAYGVDPSQVRQGGLDLATRVGEAAAQAGAGNMARNRTEQQGYEMIANAINQGAGLASQITGSSSAGGQSGTGAVNTKLATTASGAQTTGTPAQWQQIGNQGATSWSNMASQSYNDQMKKYQADQSSSSGWGELIGAGLDLAKTFLLADGGAIPEEMSPSGGQVTDDVPAQINGGPEARLNAGEFVMPRRTVNWLGEKGMQAIIAKADKEMGIPEQPKAEPTQGPAGQPPPSFEGAGIPA